MLTPTKVSNLPAFAITVVVVEGFIVSDSDGSDSRGELVSLKVQLKSRCHWRFREVPEQVCATQNGSSGLRLSRSHSFPVDVLNVAKKKACCRCLDKDCGG
jgi:hypothetical protein